MRKESISTASKFSQNPALIIRFKGNNLLEKTTALGGVEIGIINARLAAKVTGIAIISGFCKPKAALTTNTIGIIIVVSATLLISSVKNTPNRTKKTEAANQALFGNTDDQLPINSKKPVLLNPLAKVIPPPNITKMDHETLGNSL